MEVQGLQEDWLKGHYYDATSKGVAEMKNDHAVGRGGALADIRDLLKDIDEFCDTTEVLLDEEEDEK